MLGACAPSALANPVVPGDHPDPSLLRAGSGWYATATSGSWLPAFPVLRSADLRRWRQVGAVLERRPAWAAGDFWAPELVRRGGRVLAYYAALGRDGRRCVAVASSSHLRGPYQDHGPLVCSDVGEIDPLPVSDEHGASWLVWKQNGNSRGLPTPILASPLAPGGLTLAGAPRELLRADAPWERGLVEAPALMRRDGVFYLVYSAGLCCGPRCNYATGVARSASLLGPWEKRPEPILTEGALFRCPGHASIAGGPGGAPVFAYHAYARGDPANRRLLIARLRFGADGWPRLTQAGGAGAATPAQRIDFRGRRLGQGWQWPVGLRPAASIRGGRLRLGPGVLARQAGTATFTAAAVVAGRRRGARPGLAVMASASNGVGVELRGRRAVAWRSDDGRVTQYGAVRVGRARTLSLRVTVARRVRISVRGRGGWRRIGGEQQPPRWTAGPRVALRVTGPGGARAAFEALRIRPR
ncbi:MAG TPA: glycoside hydrolase family 43 protein [Thermoleophilaceae bacterium]|nr:glycoside hydrolase family 43 protein [Thermoleophilaceae bacterium]